MKKYYISICLLAKNENDYINEWLQWHINLGVEHFYIYDNDSSIPIINSINSDYLPYCTITDFPSASRWHVQKEAYQHCLDNFKQDNEWIAFIDGDEFINVVEKNQTLHNLLKEFEQYDALYVKWVYHNANGQLYKNDQPVRERFKKTVDIDKFNGRSFGKSIVRVNKVRTMNAHCPGIAIFYNIVNEQHQRIEYEFSENMTENRIIIEHYYTKSLEEWNERCNNGSCDPLYSRKYEDFYLHNPEMKEEAINVNR